MTQPRNLTLPCFLGDARIAPASLPPRPPPPSTLHPPPSLQLYPLCTSRAPAQRSSNLALPATPHLPLLSRAPTDSALTRER